jgi:hypothetical protein
MRKHRIKQLASVKEYDNHVPGNLIASSAPKWSALHMSLFSFPKLLPDGPVPSLPDYAIGFLYSGAVTGEISINKGKWMPRTSLGKGSIDLWLRAELALVAQ